MILQQQQQQNKQSLPSWQIFNYLFFFLKSSYKNKIQKLQKNK